MGNPVRLAVVALCGGLAVLGLALGAESQEEIFLEPDEAAQEAALSQGATGNLVILTALVAALAGTLAAVLLSRERLLRRLLAGAALFVALYAAIVLAQSAWPNYDANLDQRWANLATGLAVPNLTGTPSVLLPAMALGLAAVAGALALLRRLLGSRPDPDTPRRLLVAQVAAVLLATPFLVLAAWGNLRLLLLLPNNQPGLGPYLVALPVFALACFALVALGLAKAWRLGTYVQNGRLAGAVQESWQALSRAERVAAGAIAVLAVVAGALSATPLPQLELGRTFAVTLRAHSQFLLLLGIPLAPGFLLQRRVQRALDSAPLHGANLESATDPLARAAVVAVAASALLAAVATWFIEGAMWAWVLALLPVAILAATRLGGAASALHVFLLGFSLWAIGNTVVAYYNGNTAGILQFREAPGLLALWRTLGATVAGVAAARLAHRLAQREPGSVGLPMAIGAGACLAAVALMEMPLTAWLITRGDGEAVAVGSVVASQEPVVGILLHSIAGLLGVA
ncbi:MAG: hypothetical protein WC876_02060, partial [Candidatus Thermoplasmatota archaeon]